MRSPFRFFVTPLQIIDVLRAVDQELFLIGRSFEDDGAVFPGFYLIDRDALDIDVLGLYREVVISRIRPPIDPQNFGFSEQSADDAIIVEGGGKSSTGMLLNWKARLFSKESSMKEPFIQLCRSILALPGSSGFVDPGTQTSYPDVYVAKAASELSLLIWH